MLAEIIEGKSRLRRGDAPARGRGRRQPLADAELSSSDRVQIIEYPFDNAVKSGEVPTILTRAVEDGASGDSPR